MRIACLGEPMVEIAPAGGDLARIGVAGDTYNTAIYLARALPTGTVSYVTALGDEAMSGRIVETLTAEGIATDMIERRTGKMPGLYLISVDEAGERSFSYWRDTAAARTLFQAPCRVTLDALSAFDIVYLSGISIAILPQATRDAIKDWIDAFRAAGGRIAFDSNYRPRLWDTVDIARAETMAFWSRCDIALPSIDDEMELFGDPDGAAVIARLRAAGVVQGALKRGPDGPVALDANAQTLAVEPVQNVVDTTAAGDSFNAGFLAAYAAGADTLACLQTGHDLSARVICHRGAILPRD